jgi:hypothetical protein
MTIHKNEEWIQIAELSDDDQIFFTKEFVELVEEMGWEAKAFVGHLLGLWYDPFEHMLDFNTGDATETPDQPGEYDLNWFESPQDVVEYWAIDWSKNNKDYKPTHKAGTGLDLDANWYRDVLRAKLVSIRLPKRLIIAYRDKVIEIYRQIDEEYNKNKPSSE